MRLCNIHPTFTVKVYVKDSNYYTVNVKWSLDYYPFGMLMPNRYSSTETYRYGFNGMEKDDEVKNVSGSHLNFGARAYDSRLGKFFSPDRFATKMPFQSPYAFAANNPIFYIDANGDSIYWNGALKGSGNVMVVLVDEETVQWWGKREWAEYLDADGWSYVITDDEDDANQWLSDNNSDKLPQNLYISQHSGSTTDNRVNSFGIYHQDLDAEKANEGYEGRKVGNIQAKNIRNMNRTDDEFEEKTVEQYSIMMNYVEEGGNLYLGFCEFGVCVVKKTTNNERSSTVDVEKLENVHDFFGIEESVNIFVNTNHTSLRRHTNGSNETLTNVNDKDNPFKWLQFTGKGMVDAGFDLMITKGGVRKTATKSSAKGKGNGGSSSSGGKSKNPRFL